MSNTQTLNVNPVSAQACTGSVTVTDNNIPVNPSSVSWSSSDTSVATVDAAGGRVTAVADPAGNSTRTATITASVVVNGNTYTGNGTITVISQGDSVVVTVDFSGAFNL